MKQFFVLVLVLTRLGTACACAQENPAGTARALGVSLLGGAVLFALNYGVFLLKIKMGDAFNTALAFLLVAAILAGSVFLLRKKDGNFS